MQQWKLDLIATTALAVLALLAGYRLKRHVRFFERFCIPAPVIGGFAVSIAVLLLREAASPRSASTPRCKPRSWWPSSPPWA